MKVGDKNVSSKLNKLIYALYFTNKVKNNNNNYVRGILKGLLSIPLVLFLMQRERQKLSTRKNTSALNN